MEQFEGEQRIAIGALRERLQHVAWEWLIAGGGLEQASGRVGPECRQRHLNAIGTRCRNEASWHHATRHTDQPRSTTDFAFEGADQFARRVVHPMRVLEADHGRFGDECAE